MEEQTIKKFKIPLSDLPPISSEDAGYSVRYRFVSADKNRTSHWSPLYLIVPDFTYVTGDIHFTKSGQIAQVAWDSVEITKNTYSIAKALEYDIWVRWGRNHDTGDWLYKERVQVTSILLPIPTTWTINGVVQGTTPNRLSIEIYLKGYPIQQGTFLKMYELSNQTV